AARWDGDLSQVTVWSTTQAPQILRRLLARYLVLPEHAVRVVTQDIGGGFGPKGIVYAEDILVPFLARALGRPVRFVETRREHFLSVTQERDQWHDVELGLTREGRIVAIRDSFVHDCGAFVSWGVIVPILTSVSVPGPYRVPNYEVTFTAAYTNRVPVTPVRGAGRPQAVFVMERLLDLAAARLGLDRVVIRERNLIPPDAFPYDVGLVSRDNGPRRYDSGNYPECLRRAVEAIGWKGFTREQTGGRRLGLGLALFVEDTGLGPYEGVRVRVDYDGRVFVYSGASSQGQAHETTLAQIVADGLAVPLEQVTVVPGDTDGPRARGVEVGTETGVVRVLRYVAVDDCGVMINPMVVEGQVHGGIAHGIGNALLERMAYDEHGQPITGTLMEYALPRAADVPELDVRHVVTPSPLNPLGVKGAGEGGTLPAPAAIANAVADALGVDVTEMPLTREYVWRLA